MKTNKKFMSEPLRLASLLLTCNIPHAVRKCLDGVQVCYPSCENPISDAVCHSGSYGHEKGLLEIMGLVNADEVGDLVEGWLTAEEVCARWAKHYEEGK